MQPRVAEAKRGPRNCPLRIGRTAAAVFFKECIHFTWPRCQGVALARIPWPDSSLRIKLFRFSLNDAHVASPRLTWATGSSMPKSTAGVGNSCVFDQRATHILTVSLTKLRMPADAYGVGKCLLTAAFAVHDMRSFNFAPCAPIVGRTLSPSVRMGRRVVIAYV